MAVAPSTARCARASAAGLDETVRARRARLRFVRLLRTVRCAHVCAQKRPRVDSNHDQGMSAPTTRTAMIRNSPSSLPVRLQGQETLTRACATNTVRLLAERLKRPRAHSAPVPDDRHQRVRHLATLARLHLSIDEETAFADAFDQLTRRLGGLTPPDESAQRRAKAPWTDDTPDSMARAADADTDSRDASDKRASMLPPERLDSDGRLRVRGD